MRVCILGGGGLIGRNLWQRLNVENHETVVVTRQSLPPPEFITSNWLLSSTLPLYNILVDSGPWDLVVDLRAYQPDDLKGIVEFAPIITKHWIHVSTIYVYRRLRDLFNNSNKNGFLPLQIIEETVCNPSGVYGIGKLECERIWLNAYHMYEAPITIVRLPFVYGRYDRSKRVKFYIDKLLAKQPIPLPGLGQNKVDLLFAEDLAWVLTKMAGLKDSIGEIYNVALQQPMPFCSHIEMMAELLGVPVYIEANEMSNVEPGPFAYPVDIVLDNSKLLHLLSEIPISPLIETWQKTIDWEMFSI